MLGLKLNHVSKRGQDGHFWGYYPDIQVPHILVKTFIRRWLRLKRGHKDSGPNDGRQGETHHWIQLNKHLGTDIHLLGVSEVEASRDQIRNNTMIRD